MKTSKTFQHKESGSRARHVIKGGVTAVVVALFGSSWGSDICMAQEGDVDVQGVHVLTRGPVHEAFAGIVSFNPVPGVLVQKAPPEALEEIPPSERPEGNNITWIPGYWAWDDERSDYLWVSGTWRALPPGRQWMAGYWGNTTQGYQWTSGYWADATVRETTYLPAPPATVEDGPNTKAPSRDYGWTPGNWMWSQERYAWSPGYWARGRSDWNWMPAHYVWTPRGYIYVDGYWDYSMERRGTLFAPVYFDSGVYARQGYNYTPSIVMGLAMFAEHLFLRPNYHHYYFGDYYDSGYNRNGYFSAFSYQSNRNGYDPIYSHQRWQHREDHEWNQRAQKNHSYRIENQNARPPRTWDAMRKIDANTVEAKQNALMVAAPIDQLAKKKDGRVRFQSVAKEDRNMLVQRGQEMRKTSTERRTLEAKGDSPESIKKPGEAATITKVKLPKSPIVAKSASQFEKSQAPPAAQRSPKIESLDKHPKTETSGRQPKIDQPVPDKVERKKPQPEKVKEQPEKVREHPVKSPEKVEKKVQPAPERRVKETPEKVKEQPARVQEQPSRKSPEKAPQRDTPPSTKEDPSSNSSETDEPGKKDRKKGNTRD